MERGKERGHEDGANLPDGCNSTKLWKYVEGYGKLVDAYVPGKKDVSGRLFGFVRFIRVSNLKELLRNLDGLTLGGQSVIVNVVRHDRPKMGKTDDGRYSEKIKWKGGSQMKSVNKVMSRHVGSTSFKEVLQGHQRQLHKERDLKKDRNDGKKDVGRIAWLSSLATWNSAITTGWTHAYGLGECSIRYIGGLSVLLQFNSKAIADCFLRNQKVNWSVWFTWLRVWDSTLKQETRAVWLKIRGVPIDCWDTVIFSHIAEKFGRVLIPVDCSEEDMDMSYGKICVLCPSMEVIGPCTVTVTWKNIKFVVHVKEEGDWKPTPVYSEQSSDSDGESEKWMGGDEFEQEDRQFVNEDVPDENVNSDGDGVSPEKTTNSTHAQNLGGVQSQIRKDGSVNEGNPYSSSGEEDARASVECVEDSFQGSGLNGPIGPGGSFSLNDSLEENGLPDLNNPMVEIREDTRSNKASQGILIEKGG
ncbi:hypothetical protein LXL04_001400 [Taraxacum kok-saghyz]